jgi:glycosyltransferase involved in cell wall biosynthesis
MKILYTLNSGDPGGMEQHTLDLVRGMSANGHEVYVWCLEGVITEWFEEAGAKVFIEPVQLDLDPLYIFSLARFIKKEKIDVVHAHELKAGVNSLLGASLAGAKVRISHTHTPISTWQISPLAKKINITIYSFMVNLLAGREIALTESRKVVKIKEGIRENKLQVVPNGLDTEKFNIPSDLKKEYRREILQRYGLPEDSYVIGNLSRLTEEKGHSILVDAFQKFLEYQVLDKEKVRLLIAGGGKLEEEVRSQISLFGLRDLAVVTGKFSQEDLVKFYSAFDMFVFPSLAEGFGIVLIEAMYSGLPIICSDLDVLKEVGGSTVMYFESGNPDDLSEKVLHLYQKRDRLEGLTEGARQRVEDLFTMEKFISAYEGLYLDLLEKNI